MGMRLLNEEVQEILRKFIVSDDQLKSISIKIEKEMKAGLAKVDGSSIAMLPSYVPALPDGSEEGQYVAIDLSGKNLRIMLLTLKGLGKEPIAVNNNYIVPSHVMKGTGDQLFTFIVNCLQRFLQEFGLVEANLPIGFVFSYPCELLSIRSARLLWWTKGFDIKDCLRKDVVQLLEEALEMNMSTKAQIKAVMNDTVGQLAAAGHKYGPECTIGVVIGYGCNSSYLEKTSKITKFDAVSMGYSHPNMVVVTEWEEFGSKGELDAILTQFDREIDAASVHQGKQMYRFIDKLTGALYLGELVRRVLSQLLLDRILFDGQPCEKLDEPDTFPTKYISEILAEEEGSYKTCRRICDELDVPMHGSADYLIIREVCYAVSNRSAGIVAAAISALLRHVDVSHIKIGVGGALIQFHPTYHRLLHDKLRNLTPDSVQRCQFRSLNLQEYQSKELLNKYGCSVQKFIVATSEDDAAEKLQDFVKALRLKNNNEDNQDWPFRLESEGESLAILVRRIHVNNHPFETVKDLQFTISKECSEVDSGVIKNLVNSMPERIFQEPVDIESGLSDTQAVKIAENLQFKGYLTQSAAEEIKRLYNLFISVDATQVEINPFVETHDGRVFCVDAKMNFDDSAAFRQKEIFAMEDNSEQDAREVEAHHYHLNYIGMDGNIACLVNGAGLAMATMDIIKLKGGEPANFLDVGGAVTEEQVFHAFRIITSDPQVKCVLVNIFGGIVNCVTIANGVVAACRKMDLRVPLVVRIEGTNVDEARHIMKQSGLPIITASNLSEAAEKAVAALPR
uniref:hexokinase n=1 Tax=Heterorhabditis bacteriophora TaxID=37862 RepID=A0A1I7XRW2_HETBA